MVGKMFLKKLYISKFRGIDEREVDLCKRLNIIVSEKRIGKTSIVDSILFLQRYVLSPSYSLEPLLHTWFTSSLTHFGSRKSSIIVEIVDNNEKVFFGLDIDVKKNTIEEKYVYKDTVLATKEGDWAIYNVYIDSSKLLTREAGKLGENIWENIEKKLLRFTKPVTKTVTGAISAEILYYGFKTAYETLPQSIADTLLSIAKDLRSKHIELLRNRLVYILKYAFKINYFLRNSIVIRGIDYKNAIGPSKLRGSIIDPYCSNLPWIIYSIQRRGQLDCVNSCLENLGISEYVRGVEKTIDRRYYLVLSMEKHIIARESIPLSVIKSLLLCTSICYPSNIIVIDDYDDYLDKSLVQSILKYLKKVDRQVVFTSRREIDHSVIDYENSIIILQ